MRPRRAASRMRRASPVVEIQPDQGGSVQGSAEGGVGLPIGVGEDMGGGYTWGLG